MSDDFVSRFTCADCAADVAAHGLNVCPVPPLCHVCAWLAMEYQDDPIEREAVRAAIEGRRPVATTAAAIRT